MGYIFHLLSSRGKRPCRREPAEARRPSHFQCCRVMSLTRPHGVARLLRACAGVRGRLHVFRELLPAPRRQVALSGRQSPISCPLGLVHAWDSLCSGPIFSSASPSPSKPRSERVEWQHPFQQTSFGAWPTSPIPMLLRLSHAFYGSSAQHCKNLHKLQSLS